MGVAISPSTLIRWGGLAAMVAGVAYAVQGLLVPPLVRLLLPKDAAQMDPAPTEERIPPEKVIPGATIIEDINTVFFVLLVMSVIALIVSVHAIQIDSYGPGAVERIGLGALSVLPSIVGVTLILVGYLGDTGGLRYQVLADLRPVAQNLELLGWVVASVSLLVLAIVTLIVRELPWWAGIAMIAGNPLIAVFMGPLVGVPWALVGYAVLRAAGRRTEQPSRVS
jgi:hypothetical protein